MNLYIPHNRRTPLQAEEALGPISISRELWFVFDFGGGKKNNLIQSFCHITYIRQKNKYSNSCVVRNFFSELIKKPFMYSFLYIILQFPRKAVTIGLYFKTRVCHGWQVVILSSRSNETYVFYSTKNMLIFHTLKF